MSKRIVSVLGARPQFVKAAVVSAALQDFGHEEVMVHTGQHYDYNMSEVFFQALNIPKPRYSLGIGGGLHGEMTGRQLMAIEQCLLTEKPDLVLVYGDTNSTLAGALAAVKLHIPVAHVEAGLRSFNMRMPEEVNRILTDRISRWLFTPSVIASGHLRAEGIASECVIEVGDVMHDAVLRFSRGDVELPVALPQRYGLVTIHRAENTDDEAHLEAIVDGLCRVAGSLPLIMPIHPRTRQRLATLGWLERLTRAVQVLEPVGYLEMLALQKHADVVITDSGGIQKEAFFLQVPCITLREETEWVETVDLGWNRLVPGLSGPSIEAAVLGAGRPETAQAQPYGDGRASARIAAALG
ncbi:non-hydrolyzing UDP-N-acetylglucosamine 2-epimerase [Roseateles violae]|uniref:UDP-N-acetylglucosamine 2-epimerase (Non-hydrolyzing) n=1 Tax=Roseateles violae TaxID=3058042 RepID=A0ABT8DVY7_9BURK|nr:UDP-N-acetylglucosamine 2-epimerase (non-hydrolyzing) [Pelomonas sp. PFR6]MDN3920459.1 UDP-N-acetylglucosamine 2-epimerase (non-hydrolyzing) [Pelomonas sp. PFR6]